MGLRRSSVYQHLYEIAFVLKIVVAVTLCFREERSNKTFATEASTSMVTGATTPSQNSDEQIPTDATATKKNSPSIFMIGVMLVVDMLVLAIILATQAFKKCREKMTSERLVIVLVIPTVLTIVEMVLLVILEPKAFTDFPGNGIYRAAFTFDAAFLLVSLIIILLSFIWPKNPMEKDPIDLAEEGKNPAASDNKKTGEVIIVANTPVPRTTAGEVDKNKLEENKVVHKARVEDAPVPQKSRKSRMSKSLNLEKKKSVRLDKNDEAKMNKSTRV